LEDFLLISPDSNDGNIGSESLADTTGENQDGESSDLAMEQNKSTSNTNTANEASEEDNKEETEDDNNTWDDTYNQKEGGDNEDDEDNEEKHYKPCKNISSNFVLYGILRFLRLPMATVNCIFVWFFGWLVGWLVHGWLVG
jgi:hypothetical protein